MLHNTSGEIVYISDRNKGQHFRFFFGINSSLPCTVCCVLCAACLLCV